MQVNMHDLYDNTGKIKDEMTDTLQGHKRLHALLPNLQLINQSLHSKSDTHIQEEALAGLYFSFMGTGPINTVDDIKSVQIAYQSQNRHGILAMNKGDQISLLQIRISTAQLASALGETEDQVVQYFSSMREKLGNDNGVIQLPFTNKMAITSTPILSHSGHAISLAGHVYAAVFHLIEQLQMLNHLSECESCQSKLFQAQNLIETLEHETLNLKHLAQQVGLNTEALAIGFYLLVGQSIEHYWTHSRIKFAAARLRQNPNEKDNIVAQSGFSEDQFEAAFIQHFGVSSHQYGQIH